MAVIGSPAYFAAHPRPQTPRDLDQHNCVGYRLGGRTFYRWDFTDPANGQDFAVEPRGTFVTNADDMMVSAALQGVGLVMHMEVEVRAHLASGTLVGVLDRWCPPFAGFDLYVPSRNQMPAKLITRVSESLMRM